MAPEVKKTITGEDQWTDPIPIKPRKLGGIYNISIRGSFIATITLQRYIDGSWEEVKRWTAPTQSYGIEAQKLNYRIGVDEGDYIQGTIYLLLGR